MKIKTMNKDNSLKKVKQLKWNLICVIYSEFWINYISNKIPKKSIKNDLIIYKSKKLALNKIEHFFKKNEIHKEIIQILKT